MVERGLKAWGCGETCGETCGKSVKLCEARYQWAHSRRELSTGLGSYPQVFENLWRNLWKVSKARAALAVSGLRLADFQEAERLRCAVTTLHATTTRAVDCTLNIGSDMGRISFNAGARTKEALTQLQGHYEMDRANALRWVICHTATTLGLLGVACKGTSEDT